MKYLITYVMIGALALPAKSQTTSDASEKVKQVLKDYFDGIGTRNTNKMKAAVTADFFLYEEGKVWTNDSVFSEMKRFPYAKAHFKFENFRVNVDNTSAYMAYYEEANFLMTDSTKHILNFLGSAAFRKVRDEWKMNFLHSDQRYVSKKK